MRLVLFLFYSLIFFNCLGQDKTIIDSDCLQVNVDSLPIKNHKFLKVTLMSGFNDSVKLSFQGKVIYSGKCVTEETTGRTLRLNQALYISQKNMDFEIYMSKEKIYSKVNILNGYSFLYVYKTGNKLIFNFVNKESWGE